MKYSILFACLIVGIKTHCQIITSLNDEVPFAIVEDVPVYKGCDESMSTDMKRKCMSDKISELISENFNRDIATNLNIPPGPVRISAMFKIDAEGSIVDIDTRAQYPSLEEEAIRVIKLIPQMTPGRMRGKPVVVPYSLPIVFQVEGESESNTTRTFPVYRGCNKNLDFEALKKCTTESIMDFVRVSTIIDDADELFLTDRSTEFEASFVIDKKGKIKDIGAKAYKRELGVLVIRALQQLPKMKEPGTINGKPVDVPFKFKMTLYFN